MTRRPKDPPLTASEERILRSTIDDPQIFEVPVRTVKKLLARLDVLRPGGPPEKDGPTGIDAATERIREDATDFRVTPVPEIAFVCSRVDRPFYMRLGTEPDPIAHGIFTRAEAAALMRSDFIDTIFNVTRILPESGATAQTTRPGSEIADLLERGALP